MLTCTVCGAERSFEDFYEVSAKGRRATNGKQYNTQCKACLRSKTRAAQAAKRKWLNEYKLESGCADCGYREHACALDFDHLPGFPKSFDLKTARASVGWSRLKAEVEKCEVVCANCHRVRTEGRRRSSV